MPVETAIVALVHAAVRSRHLYGPSAIERHTPVHRLAYGTWVFALLG